MSPDGRWVAAQTWEGVLRIWDSNSGKVLRDQPRNPRGIHSLAFSPDGERLLVGGLEEAVLLSVSSGKIEVTYSPTKEGFDAVPNQALEKVKPVIKPMVFSPNGKRILLGFDVRPNLALMETETGKLASILKTRVMKVVLAAQFLPDGRSILLGHSHLGSVILLDVDGGKPTFEFKNGPTSADVLGVSADGRYALSGAAGEAILWRLPEAP